MKFRLYKNATGDWAWTLIARNGKKVANGGEGYKRFGAMCRTLRAIFGTSPHSHAPGRRDIHARQGFGMKYALFSFEPGGAAGGIRDLQLIGTMEECMAHFETIKHYQHIATIIRIDDLLTIEKTGEWTWAEPAPLGALIRFRLEWTDAKKGLAQ